ncbi:MAG: molybdopterin-binding protein [Thermosynechococcaceae cyanobacterium MS004]|nr:molybdopterin-binding protein [Thermosynechococcaceae cyanobacterium MS004]
MPRKDQGWITFQTSEEERQLLEEICRQSQRTKTEVLREMVRGLKYSTSADVDESEPDLKSRQPNKAREAQPNKPDTDRKKPLKVSARNILEGRVKQLTKGSVNTEVTLEILQLVELTSIITTTSAEALELAEGKAAYAVIKSSDVVIATE